MEPVSRKKIEINRFWPFTYFKNIAWQWINNRNGICRVDLRVGCGFRCKFVSARSYLPVTGRYIRGPSLGPQRAKCMSRNDTNIRPRRDSTTLSVC